MEDIYVVKELIVVDQEQSSKNVELLASEIANTFDKLVRDDLRIAKLFSKKQVISSKESKANEIEQAIDVTDGGKDTSPQKLKTRAWRVAAQNNRHKWKQVRTNEKQKIDMQLVNSIPLFLGTSGHVSGAVARDHSVEQGAGEVHSDSDSRRTIGDTPIVSEMSRDSVSGREKSEPADQNIWSKSTNPILGQQHEGITQGFHEKGLSTRVKSEGQQGMGNVSIDARLPNEVQVGLGQVNTPGPYTSFGYDRQNATGKKGQDSWDGKDSLLNGDPQSKRGTARRGSKGSVVSI